MLQDFADFRVSFIGAFFHGVYPRVHRASFQVAIAEVFYAAVGFFVRLGSLANALRALGVGPNGLIAGSLTMVITGAVFQMVQTAWDVGM
jgi:hypothetical protein